MEIDDTVTRAQAALVARNYCAEHYPTAEIVFLCGSVVRGTAHSDSDIDIVVLVPDLPELCFEATYYESWLLDVCAISPERLEHLFRQAENPD